MKKPLAIILTLAVIFAALLGWRIHAQSEQAQAPSGGSATVEGVESVVGARISGRVKEVLAHEGDRVKRGQTLVRIDCRDNQATLNVAIARKEAAEAQVGVYEAQHGSASDSAKVARAQAAAVRAQAKVLEVQKQQSARDRQRAEALASRGAIPGVELEHSTTHLEGLDQQLKVASAQGTAAELGARASKSSVKVVDASLAVAQAQVAASKADVERAKIAVAECEITAPSDGIVTGRLVEPGAVVGPGSRLMVTVAVDPAKVTFFLPDAELSRASIGAPASVRVDAYPDRVFKGIVSRVAAEAEFTPRNVQTREDRDRLVYEVEVRVENHEGLLRPGMPGDVSLDGTER
ncbi:MAG: HlyD family efflux transporter periplasmic adaptor subunit [Myxococcales bacterium]|nr:HlyD family efflux transporter periplasmic adaptor subunit [Myxococcales bacterium]